MADLEDGAEDDVDRLATKKRSVETELARVERQIFDLECNYLRDTAKSGNVLVGWHGYRDMIGASSRGASARGGPSSSKGKEQSKKKQRTEPRAAERLFSLSSVTSPAATGR